MPQRVTMVQTQVGEPPLVLNVTHQNMKVENKHHNTHHEISEEGSTLKEMMENPHNWQNKSELQQVYCATDPFEMEVLAVAQQQNQQHPSKFPSESWYISSCQPEL